MELPGFHGHSLSFLDFMVKHGAPGFHGHRWSWRDNMVIVKAGGISWPQKELPGFYGHRWCSKILWAHLNQQGFPVHKSSC